MLYQMPFSPYDVQQKMMNCIEEGLEGKGKHAKPLIVTEVPTGCGKTLALLSSVLQFQHRVSQLSSKEQLHFFKEREPEQVAFLCGLTPNDDAIHIKTHLGSVRSLPANRAQERKKRLRNDHHRAENDDQDSLWAPDAEFMMHFHRFQRSSGTKHKNRAMMMDAGKSSALRRQFSRPPCTIFYATRTHGQLHQITKELRKLIQCSEFSPTSPASSCCSTSCSRISPSRSCPLRMNILASRDHYCIHGLLHKVKAQGKLPIEGNNLGEMCDKLVALNQCPCVEHYDVLGCSAIDGQGIGFHKGEPVWDIEDLVMEGVATQKCPYYASRDLVFYADLNLCTYPYLLDPVIRHECHFEGAVKNNSIIIIDEAHNVSQVCEEFLSIQCSHYFFEEVIECLLPFISPPEGTTVVPSYPREFKLSDGSTLLDLFSFLSTLLSEISTYFLQIASSADHVDAQDLATRIKHRFARSSVASEYRLSGKSSGQPSENVDAWFQSFRKVYGIILSLGVTFNPFDFPLHILSILKRWLVILRFLFQKPKAFAVRSQFGTCKEENSLEAGKFQMSIGIESAKTNLECEVRCLDGSLAFSHLLRAAFRIILSSGTLTPFSQLSRSLGVPPTMWYCFEGDHVVPDTNYAVHVLTKTHPRQLPLRCTFSSFSSDSFFQDLGETILQIVCKSLKKAGAVVIVPNYQVLSKLYQQLQCILEDFWRRPSHARERGYLSRLSCSRVFKEPRQSSGLQVVLAEYKAMTLEHVALFIGVYRGKSGEGLDFSDDMARMVFCLGVPFRPVTSWSVGAKRRYSGEAWYVEDALCAVNQALGRCLRHKGDFGAIILLDERYRNEERYQSMLSRWCRQVISVYDSVIPLIVSLQKCFEVWSQLPLEKDRRSIKSDGVLGIDSLQGGHCKDDVPIASINKESSSALRVLSRRNEQRNYDGTVKVPVRFAGGSSCKRDREVEHIEEFRSSTTGRSIREHIFSCTAVKLLYEQCHDTAEITPSSLRKGVAELETNFLRDFDE